MNDLMEGDEIKERPMVEEVSPKKKSWYHRRAYKRIYLQDRDLEIFNYGLEQKFLTVEQISRRFFDPKKTTKDRHQAAYRRALILQRFQMLKIQPLVTGERVMLITDTGANELTKLGWDHLEPIKAVDYRYFEHDKRVTDCRITFENLGLTSWRSERHLKKETGFKRVPDGIMRLKKGYRIALEVEVAVKAKERYEKIFEDYRERFPEVQFLFYVCQTLSQLKNLAEMTDGLRWVFYALYDQLMKNHGETVFANKSDRFRLREVVG